MPSFQININKDVTIQINLTHQSTRGITITWIGGENKLFCAVVGTDVDEQIVWTLPQLSIGDNIVVKISENSVIETPASRSPLDRNRRSRR